MKGLLVEGESCWAREPQMQVRLRHSFSEEAHQMSAFCSVSRPQQYWALTKFVTGSVTRRKVNV